MSDSEESGVMFELQEIMAEYKSKETTEDDNVKIEEDNVNSLKVEKGSSQVIVKTVKKGNSQAIMKSAKKPRSNLEVPMDKIIFGDKVGFIKKLAKAVGENQSDEDSDEKQSGDNSYEESEEKQNRKATKRKPVWSDADDEQIKVGEIKRETKFSGPLDHLQKDATYKEYLTTRFTRIVAQPKWADLQSKPKRNDNVDSDDDELLHTVGFLAKPAAIALRPREIQCKRLKDLNRATYAEGSISCVRFHPTSTAALVCGRAGIATIYSIDGLKNEKLHSIGFRDFPIKCAHITPCGTQAIFGSIKRHFYSYDLLAAQETRHRLPQNITKFDKFELSPCGRYIALAGRFGELHLLDAASKETITTFKQEDPIAAVRFTGDSQRIIASSESSTVSIFEIRTRRLEHSFIDDGCIKGHVLDLASNQRLLATGSMEGVVNIYDFDKVMTSKAPQPEKRILNLTTEISDIKFNHTSELLAMCSGDVASAVKLVHFPSATVFANFPGFKSDIGEIRCVEFSPSSGYLACGNRSKEVSLYRIKHYKNY